MLRFLLLLGLGALLCSTRSDQPGPRAPLPAESITVDALPIDLVPGEPARMQLGRLRYLGGWRLQSHSANFGGISAIEVRNGTVLAASDNGLMIRFPPPGNGRAFAAEMWPLPLGCGSRNTKSGQDVEAFVRTPDANDLLVALEGKNWFCRFDAQGRHTLAAFRPAAMGGWNLANGAEAIAALPGGRIAVFREAGEGDGPRGTLVLVFAGDPTKPGQKVDRFSYRSPRGYSPVDAHSLPDGRVLVLNRRFALPFRFTAILTLVDFEGRRPDTPLVGQEVARFAPPVLNDNFEAISVEQSPDGLILWLASDNNYVFWQRSYLLKFRLSLPPRAPHSAAPPR